MKEKFVLAFGEILWDLLPTGPVLGGAVANFALRVHNLGLPVKLVSSLGDDDFGLQARILLKEFGLDDSWIQKNNDSPTGTVEVKLSNDGNASYNIIQDVAYDHIQLTPELEELAMQASVICYGSLIQRHYRSRETLLKLLRLAPNATKIVDINLRKDCYTPETLDSSLLYANILKLNESEVPVVSKALRGIELDSHDFCDLIFTYYGISKILITRAENGVYARSKDGEVLDVPGYKVEVVDTIGAGDAFTAGFISQFVAGKPFEDCCKFGNKLGALVATTRGGMALLKEDIAL
jgi:fructokinase